MMMLWRHGTELSHWAWSLIRNKKNNCSLWETLPCNWEVRGHCMCKEMPVNKVTTPKRIIGKNGGPMRRKGTRGRWPKKELSHSPQEQKIRVWIPPWLKKNSLTRCRWWAAFQCPDRRRDLPGARGRARTWRRPRSGVDFMKPFRPKFTGKSLFDQT
jgi:hypothetical protein